ncbi:hypothetical protein BROUX41_003702 [Berkeleyomyces rouxiae]|uniref:uncharacterized protein n=1 Tax=Berkeleyomyces rouxiae TaxID=2035830 RepID=UPI003B7D0AF6
MDPYARASGSPSSTAFGSHSPSPHPRSASPTVLANMRRFHARPSSSSSLSSISSSTSYKSAPAQPELSLDPDSSAGICTARPRRSGSLLASPFAPPPPLPASSLPAASVSIRPAAASNALASDSDSDDEEYIRFPNGAFTDPLPETDHYPPQPYRPSSSSPGLSRASSTSSASSPGRSSGRSSCLQIRHDHSPVYESEVDAIMSSPVQHGATAKARSRRYSAGSKFTTRTSESQKYYYGSGIASSISSASEYLSNYVTNEAVKKGSKSPKRVRFSLPV